MVIRAGGARLEVLALVLGMCCFRHQACAVRLHSRTLLRILHVDPPPRPERPEALWKAEPRERGCAWLSLTSG